MLRRRPRGFACLVVGCWRVSWFGRVVVVGCHCVGGCMDAWMHGYMDAWKDGWMDGWVDGWMDAVSLGRAQRLPRNADQSSPAKDWAMHRVMMRYYVVWLLGSLVACLVSLLGRVVSSLVGRLVGTPLVDGCMDGCWAASRPGAVSAGSRRSG